MVERTMFDFQKEIGQLKEQFGFDYVALALVQSSERRFELKWTFMAGNRSERYRRIKLQSGKGVAGLVFKTGKPMYIGDAESELKEMDLFNYPIVVAEGLKSFGAIPLYKYNRVLGVLLVGYRTEMGLTPMQFEAFKQRIGPRFGPFYNKEMVTDESDE